MKHGACKALERVMNRYLALDEMTLGRISDLEHKVVAFHVKRPKLTLYFIFQSDSISVCDDHEGEVHTHIYATIFQLMKMKHGKTSTNRDLFITGDFEVARVLNTILKQHDIDWEEHMSHFLGDALAHKFGRVVAKQKRFFKRATRSMKENVSEFLQEEANCLPPKQMLEDFYNEVDSVRLRAERLQARIDLMKQPLEGAS
jgi:ubiquinone biosynthesis protein UbiJ